MRINEVINEGSAGLWDNIRKKRQRIKAGSGERMRKPGSKGAPTEQNFKDAASESVQTTTSSPVQKIPKMIVVDGKNRHTRNSNGQLIYSTIDGINNFWKWFGNSKVVDANGDPRLMVHASPSGDIKTFKEAKDGIWFAPADNTTEADIVASYDTGRGYIENPNEDEFPSVAVGSTFYPVYVRIKNPAPLDHPGVVSGYPAVERLKKEGFDGVIYEDGTTVAFHPTQIKSVIGNNGEFNPNNPKITESKKRMKTNRYGDIFKQTVGSEVNNIIVENTDNQFNRMMNKISSPDALKTREALALITDLMTNGGATYSEALEQSSDSYDIDQNKLHLLYKKRSAGLAERDDSKKRKFQSVEYLEETYDNDNDFFQEYGILSYDDGMLNEAEYQGRKVTLNKPVRSSNGPKKFHVFVKNKKGNVVKVNFGDPKSKIKKHIPGRRKNFRARHNCDTAKDKTTARYWSCRAW
jgi:hypothetical protein